MFKVSKQGPCFTATEEVEVTKRLAWLELACKADGVALPDTGESDHSCHC